MKSLLVSLLSLIVLFAFVDAVSPNPPRKDAILVFSKTKGFRHQSIPDGKLALLKMGKQIGIRVDTTEDASAFTPANLRKYKALVFLSTSGEVFDEEQKKAFQEYIRKGGGFVGIHGATTTEYKWPWYNQLIGAYFLDHPKPQNASIDVWNREHPATRVLPARWNRFDEWYNYRDMQPNLKVIATLDESSYKGGKHGRIHPFAWYHEFDGGRSFYTGGGHTKESYSEPLFMKHVQEGILWAMKRRK
ncbi:ThuA domain-containing protein [Telluribacter humicola]|uniref:ThuA domain-containing protein n=1 Tax=Telluribacter humicola TaxID=1720261 RepID=UPI001A96DCC0|nr:ThuA domain-containing protein [Telluribacter humicola]